MPLAQLSGGFPGFGSLPCSAGSGRLLQPTGGARGSAIRLATAPFRLAQRAFPNTGVGLVARARLAD